MKRTFRLYRFGRFSAINLICGLVTLFAFLGTHAIGVAQIYDTFDIVSNSSFQEYEETEWFSDISQENPNELEFFIHQVSYQTNTETESEQTQTTQINSQSSAKRFSVVSCRFNWRDSSRGRSLPIRIHYPSTAETRSFPVILFSHGLGGSNESCSYLGSAWASQGFVVVQIQHPGSDENVWKGKLRPLNELRESYGSNWSGRTRAVDLLFVLNRLQYMCESDHWLSSRFDLERVGVGGYDLGALASLLLAGQIPQDGGASLHDPRIKAVVAMSPPVMPSRIDYRRTYGMIEIPGLVISGTEDDGIVGSTRSHQRRIPFDHMVRNNRYLIVLKGADHRVYGGHLLSMRAKNDKAFQSAIVRATNYFWKAFLQQDEQALTTLNSYRLNSMLGVSASIERRITSTESLSQTPAQTPSEVSEQVEPNSSSISIEATETRAFPSTRIYRDLVRKHENKTVEPFN